MTFREFSHSIYVDIYNVSINDKKGKIMRENSIVPIYQQIKEDIKKSIKDGTYKTKDQIPSEQELIKEFNASRITVRRAIEELCTEGYLVKIQGKGTFVSSPRIHRKIVGVAGWVRSFTNSCRDEGMVAGAKVLKRQIVPARKNEREFFGLEDGALLIFIERVRTADGIPVLLENHLFPYEKYKDLLSVDLNDVSLFDTVNRMYGESFVNTQSRSIEIARASADIAKVMNVPLNEPLFYMNVLFLNQDQKPLCIGHQYYLGSRYMFNL